MPKHIYNRNLDDKGNHEVHISTCPYRPSEYNQIDLGTHFSCHDAIAAAKTKIGKSNFDGCCHCCKPCHKG